MSSKPDHAKAQKTAVRLTMGAFPPVFELPELAACYLDLVKQHGELRAALELIRKNITNLYAREMSDEPVKLFHEARNRLGDIASETLARIGEIK